MKDEKLDGDKRFLGEKEVKVTTIWQRKVITFSDLLGKDMFTGRLQQSKF